MSFSENEFSFEWTCDGCGLAAEFSRGGPGSFMSCVDEIKHRGWLIQRTRDGDWSHHCAKCRRKMAATILDMPSKKFG
jgi:hypothetical protein